MLWVWRELIVAVLSDSDLFGALNVWVVSLEGVDCSCAL